MGIFIVVEPRVCVGKDHCADHAIFCPHRYWNYCLKRNNGLTSGRNMDPNEVPPRLEITDTATFYYTTCIGQMQFSLRDIDHCIIITLVLHDWYYTTNNFNARKDLCDSMHYITSCICLLVQQAALQRPWRQRKVHQFLASPLS